MCKYRVNQPLIVVNESAKYSASGPKVPEYPSTLSTEVHKCLSTLSAQVPECLIARVP